MPQAFQLLTLLGLSMTVFAVSLLVALTVAKWRRRVPAQALPEPGCTVKIRSVDGMYRARLVQAAPHSWVIEAPVQYNRYVPFREGDHLMVEAPMTGGALLFRAQVMARTTDPHTYELEPCGALHRIERRTEPRDRATRGLTASINGEAAEIQNLSKGGAMVVSEGEFANGDGVTIRIPSLDRTVFGWVLEAMPDQLGGRRAARLRITFAIED